MEIFIFLLRDKIFVNSVERFKIESNLKLSKLNKIILVPKLVLAVIFACGNRIFENFGKYKNILIVLSE